MDIKKKVEEIVAALKNDPKLLEKFTKEPVPVVEKLLGVTCLTIRCRRLWIWSRPL